MRSLALISSAILLNVIAALVLLTPLNVSEGELDQGLASEVALEERNLVACTTFVERSTLFVIGDDRANTIQIASSEGGIQVSCNGFAETFAGVNKAVVEAGDGDDTIEIDNTTGNLTAIHFSLSGQLGRDTFHIEGWTGVAELDGGGGQDRLHVEIGAPVAIITIGAGTEPGSVDARLNDPSGALLAHTLGVALEFVSVEGGDGNDEFHIGALDGIAASVIAHAGDDVTFLNTISGPGEGPAHLDVSSDGGTGVDKVIIVGTSVNENYEIQGVPDREIPDPQIRVIDPVSGVVIGDFFVRQSETIRIEAQSGNDRLDVAWDTALMSASGLERIEADLAEGEDTMTVSLLPVRTMPDPGDVQPIKFDVMAGDGDDQIFLNYAAGSWLTLHFTAQLGKGDDYCSALFISSDDGLPGPEGTRRMLLEVFAGNEDDVVAFHNQTAGELFELLVTAILEGGDDLLEASGAMTLDAQPGKGFDTARVTRNLLRFVTAFESIEPVEGGV